MSGPQAIDGLFEQWAQRGFNESRVRKCGRRGLTGLTLKASALPRSGGASRGRARVEGIARRAPQVMVRISGGGRGMRHIRAHLSYITRNGRLTARDQNGDHFDGKEGLNELGHELQAGGFPVPDVSGRREALNVILSMPAGTDAEALRRAAERFAEEEFDGHQYVLVLHRFETDPHRAPARHPHVHICVKAVGEEGVRLHPRKEDLQRWRERFAERLREQGIDAAASTRLERLQRHRGEKQAVRHKRLRGEPMHSICTVPASGERKNRALGLETQMLHRYGELARALAGSSDQHDRAMALGLTSALRDDPGRRDRSGPAPER